MVVGEYSCLDDLVITLYCWFWFVVCWFLMIVWVLVGVLVVCCWLRLPVVEWLCVCCLFVYFELWFIVHALVFV